MGLRDLASRRLGQEPTRTIKGGCFGFVFAGFASLFLVIGMGMAGYQAYRLLTSRPIAAIIESTRIESQRGSKGGTTFKPVVDFRYVVGERTYRSADVYPLTGSNGDRHDAERTISAYHPGQQVEAWVDPARPESAFLIRSASFFPALFMLFPMIHIGIGLSLALVAGQPPERKAVRLGWLTRLWCGVGVLAFGHYFLLGGAWSILVIIVLLLYTAGAGGWLFATRRAQAQCAPASGNALADEPPNPFRSN